MLETGFDTKESNAFIEALLEFLIALIPSLTIILFSEVRGTISAIVAI